VEELHRGHVAARSWSATLANTYQTSYIDVQTDPDGNTRRVGSMSLWDLQGSYTGFKNWTLTLGVKNLFDDDPRSPTRISRSSPATIPRTTMRAHGSCMDR
jgi:iron complex outermembrane receptor protein